MTAKEQSIAYVIDPDPVAVAILKKLFFSVRIKAEYFNLADHCLARVNAKSRGCILADDSAPGVNVTTLQRRLRDKGVELPVIFLSYFGDVTTAVTALKYGAADFLEKPFNGQTLLDAVHQAIESNHTNAHHRAVKQKLRARFDALTPREWDVIPLMIKGCPNRRIAEKLGISEKTVEVYRARIMRKVGVANLPKLIRIAIRIDLLCELAQCCNGAFEHLIQKPD